MRSNKGVTLIELLIVIVVIGLISSFGVVSVGNILENTRLGVDEQTIGTLNTATSYYQFYNNSDSVFDISLSDEEKIKLLVDEGFLDTEPKPQSKDAAFIWDESKTVWQLNIDGSTVSLLVYGDSFTSISENIILKMQNTYNTTGSYGRFWNDFKYTDIGLVPDDWKDPISNIIYTPFGSRLLITPESGYSFTAYSYGGDLNYMTSADSGDIIYNDLDGNWYFRYVSPEYIIDISTLVVKPS